MNTILKTLIFSLAIVLSSQANAQFLKKLGDRVEERVKETAAQKVENKAAEKTDKALDKIFNIGSGIGSDGQRGDQQQDGESGEEQEFDVEGMMNGILGGGKEVKFENSYSFGITSTMEVTDFSNPDQTQRMKQSFGKNVILTVISQGGSTILHDFNHESAIIIDESQKTAQVMSLSWMKKMMGGEVPEGDDTQRPQVSKTGKTRSIHGYTCYEYLIETETEKINAWFAPNVPFSYQDYLGGFTKMMGQSMNKLPEDQGYVMEMKMYDKAGKETYQMKVVELSEQGTSLNLSDYKVQKLF